MVCGLRSFRNSGLKRVCFSRFGSGFLDTWSFLGFLDSDFQDFLDQVFLRIGFDDVKMACFSVLSKSIRLRRVELRFLD
jgi:hypothetical protein